MTLMMTPTYLLQSSFEQICRCTWAGAPYSFHQRQVASPVMALCIAKAATARLSPLDRVPPS
jgi:hypothetical protein